MRRSSESSQGITAHQIMGDGCAASIRDIGVCAPVYDNADLLRSQIISDGKERLAPTVVEADPHPIHVLVVDDNQDDREAIRRMLSHIHAFETMVCESPGGDDTLRLLQCDSFDCIFLDYSLPGWTGIDLLRRFRDMGLQTPVVMLTGAGNEDIAVQAMKEGARDYITKSNLATNSLQRILTTVMEYRRLSQHIAAQRERILRQQREITEKTQLNEAVLDAAPCMIIATDTAGRIRSFNRAAERLTGFSAAEAIGRMTLIDLLEPDGRDAAMDWLEGGARNPDALPSGWAPLIKARECLVRRQNGQSFAGLLSLVPLASRGSRMDGYLATIDDISLRKKHAAALRHNDEVLRMSMAGAPTGIALIDTRMRWLLINPALCQLLNDDLAKIRKRKFDTLFHEEDIGLIHDDLGTLIEGANTTVQRECRLLAKGGVPIWVILSVSLIRHQDGRPRHFTLQFMDISARKEIDRMKSEFVSIVSHELRTPLTSISGSLGLALNVQDSLPLFVTNLLQIASRNCERLANLVNDILDIDRISCGEMSYTLAPQRVDHLVEQVIDANKGYAVRFDVTLRAEHGDRSAAVMIDIDRAVQILSNLVSNAIKFSPSGGHVAIFSREAGEFIEIAVRDHGCGIPPEYEPRMFLRFAQADSSNTRKKNGSGLGLFIAKQMTEQMGGQIGYMPTEGGGSTFWIRLPRATTEAAIPVVERFRRRPDGSRIPAILHVEDDHELAQTLQQAMGGIADIVVAPTLAEARSRIRDGLYDLVVLDQHLPDGNGLELLREQDETMPPTFVIWTGERLGPVRTAENVKVFRKTIHSLRTVVKELTRMVA